MGLAKVSKEALGNYSEHSHASVIRIYIILNLIFYLPVF